MVIVEVQQILVHQTYKLSHSNCEFSDRPGLESHRFSRGERNAAML